MHRRLILAGLAAAGALATSAFLRTAVAAADTAGPDAFTIGDFTFDPINASGVEGFDGVPTLEGASPLLELGGGTALGILPLATQDFNVYDPATGAELGSIDGNETVMSLFGFTNAEFTVASATPADGVDASSLPTVGSVYDVFNLGNGSENVYTAIPSTTGGPDTVTDVLVTPNGDLNLNSLFGSIDAAAPLQPGDAFIGLEKSGDGFIGPDAFTIGGFTLDPINSHGVEGFDPITPLATSPPLLELGGSSLGDPTNPNDDFATQGFEVFSGGGPGATEVGTITTGEDVTQLLGFTNTQLIVTGATPTGDGTAADLPTVGSVYDAFNYMNAYENVYTAIPSTTGGPDTVTDTLITPYGNFNLGSPFTAMDAAAPMQPGDAFTGLQTPGDSAIGADAFTIGSTTFDPITNGGAEGYNTVFQILGAPPVLEIGGGTPVIDGLSLPINPQDFNVYDGVTKIGSIVGNEDVTNLLGMTNTEFTVAGVTGTSPDLPTVGSVYDAFNLGGGFENVYTAIPGVDGAPDTVTDTLVTPLGNIDLSSLVGAVDAAAPLDPGDAFTAGLDAASAAVTSVDPLAFLGL
jgi:hypothetical protein